MLGRCVDQALTLLQDAQGRGGVQQRQALTDAWRELLGVRSEWVGRYPRLLEAAARPAEPISNSSAQRASEDPDTLTLVGEEEVDQELEQAKLLALLLSTVEPALGELDRLVCSQMGLDTVRAEQNPVRPAVFSQALRTLMNEGEHPLPLQRWWLRYLAPALGAELALFYRRQADRLTQAGVLPVNYRFVATASALAPLRAEMGGDTAAAEFSREQGPPGHRPEPRSRSAGPLSSDPRVRGGSALANLSNERQGHEWVRDFLRSSGSSAHAPLAPGYYARVASDLSELQALPPETPAAVDPQQVRRYRETPVVDRPIRPVSTETPLDDATWGDYSGPRQRALIRTQLKQQAQKVDQVLGLELVRKLLDQVAQDPRLLTPVREAIVALEPALLRMALVEPRFFTEDRHPGRCLVERVAERSLRFNDEFSADFKDYLREVVGCFSALNANEACAAADFTRALEILEAAWIAWDTQEEQKRAQVLEAVRFAEKRQVMANEIARNMSERTDLADVPPEVQQFLYGTWALVMAHARLTDRSGHVDPGAHGSVVTDLLWSVKRQSGMRQPARLFALIPPLLERLRIGLASLGQTAQENAAFFELLERLHRPVLDWRASKRLKGGAAALPEMGLDADLPRPAPRQQPQASDTPWLARRELEVAGFQDTQLEEGPVSEQPPEAAPGVPAKQVAAPLAKATGAPAAPRPEPRQGHSTGAALDVHEVERVIASLQQGCWVDLYSKQQWVRARLAWASNKGTLFMFVSRSGQPHSMTRRICERLLRDRLLRPVKMHGVVSHAIGVVGQVSASTPASRLSPLDT